MTFFAHADDSEPGNQYLEAAKAGDRRARYFFADSWFSSGGLSETEYRAQKAAGSGDADVCALLVQIKITNLASLDYPQAKVPAEKAAQAGSKEGEVTLAYILVNTQAGKSDYPKVISLLENTSENLESDSTVDAQMLLGLTYANGMGIKADDDKTTWYLKRSSTISRTGYSEHWVGMASLSGEEGFTKKNEQEALHWLDPSCIERFDIGCEEFERLADG